jgi:hypothetical protein
MRYLLLIFLVVVSCGTPHSNRERLRKTVTKFYEDLRWKRFDSAAQHIPEDKQDTFLQHCLDTEDDLAIDNLEIRSVTLDDKHKTAQVMLQAEYILLPSTVVQKRRLSQRWKKKSGAWYLEDDLKEFFGLIAAAYRPEQPLKQLTDPTKER